jgi:cytochrome P450 family 142 subfamily A polypeptide 1
LRLMTDRVLERLPDLRLAADDDVLPLRPANFVSGLESMPMLFTPSAPLA